MRRLVHDVLEKALVDRERRPMGRVDGIGLELRRGAPPRVAFLEVGAVSVARRIHPRLGAWLAALERRLGIGSGEPLRIPWSRVRDVGLDVRVDVDWGRSRASGWERWLERHVIGRIPGA